MKDPRPLPEPVDMADIMKKDPTEYRTQLREPWRRLLLTAHPLG